MSARQICRILCLLVLASANADCEPPPVPVVDYSPPKYKLAPQLTVSTKGVKLESIEKDWTLTFDDSPLKISGTAIVCKEEWSTKDWALALDLSKEKSVHVVRLKVRAYDQDLHGILMLCGVKNNDGPASRAYRVQIPQNYVDATEGHRISVVFESLNSGATSWALWLSQDPFR